MKFTLNFKTPDVLEHAMENLRDYMDESMDEDDKDELIEEAKNFASRWIEWGEGISVEFDTEAQTATVL